MWKLVYCFTDTEKEAFAKSREMTKKDLVNWVEKYKDFYYVCLGSFNRYEDCEKKLHQVFSKTFCGCYEVKSTGIDAPQKIEKK